jgi:hypothetical protein
VQRIAPRPGDPDGYAIVEAEGGRFAVTATCAANALGLVAEGGHAHGNREAALAAFEALAPALRTRGAEAAARAVLDGALAKISAAVEEAASSHDLDRDVPLIALGGSADALMPELARRLGRPLIQPDDPEVLSSVGAAVSLVRAEVARAPRSVALNGRGAEAAEARLQIAREAERACVEAGAAPDTVAVESSFDVDEGVMRAVATGAVALEAGAADRAIASPQVRRAAAAAALKLATGELEPVSAAEFYEVYAGRRNGRRPVAVVDALGGVPLAEERADVVSGQAEEFLVALREAVGEASTNLGVTTLLPRVTLLAGPTMLDLSDARRIDEISAAAARAIAEHPGHAAAVIAR